MMWHTPQAHNLITWETFVPSSWTYVTIHPSSSSIPFSFATNWTPEQNCFSCKVWYSTEINFLISWGFSDTLFCMLTKHIWYFVQYSVATNLIWLVEVQLCYHLKLKQACTLTKNYIHTALEITQVNICRGH